MTPKQKRVFNFIRSTINNSGICPTYTEIMEALNIKSKAVVAHYLNALEKEGKIKINRVKARGIEIEDDENTKLKELLKECRENIAAIDYDSSVLDREQSILLNKINQVLGEE